MPVVMYGLDACPLKKSDIRSLEVACKGPVLAHRPFTFYY